MSKPVLIETLRNPCRYSLEQRQTFRILAALLESESGRFLVFVERENTSVEEDA